MNFSNTGSDRKPKSPAPSCFSSRRLLASGVRLMVACLAVSILIGWPIIPTILLFSVICIIYIAWGGIKAVVWTNVVQALTFMVAGVVAIGFLLSRLDGGAAAVVAIAGRAGKMQIFNWGPGLTASGPGQFLQSLFTDPNVFVLATLNGFFGSMAAFGTDQEIMQRLLTVETRKESQKTMLSTPIGSFLVMFIFLFIGACLYTFYAQHPGVALPAQLDKIFPHFIEQQMPALMRGLMLAAIVMASIDSPLGSLTTSFVTDIYRPVLFRSGTERHYLFVSRVGVVVFGIILAFIAYVFSHFEKFLWLAFKIGGVTYGSLLGVFLLGLLTKRQGNRVNVAGHDPGCPEHAGAVDPFREEHRPLGLDLAFVRHLFDVCHWLDFWQKRRGHPASSVGGKAPCLLTLELRF